MLSQIRDSIIGDNKCSLAEFTFHTANKYRRGQFDENMSFGYTIHNVLLVSKVVNIQMILHNTDVSIIQRRFGLNNIDLIKKATTTSANDNNGDESDSTPPPTGTKRQRTQVGRIAKGEDFWGKVDTYFVEMVAKYGRDMTSARWRE